MKVVAWNVHMMVFVPFVCRHSWGSWSKLIFVGSTPYAVSHTVVISYRSVSPADCRLGRLNSFAGYHSIVIFTGLVNKRSVSVPPKRRTLSSCRGGLILPSRSAFHITYVFSCIRASPRASFTSKVNHALSIVVILMIKRGLMVLLPNIIPLATFSVDPLLRMILLGSAIMVSCCEPFRTKSCVLLNVMLGNIIAAIEMVPEAVLGELDHVFTITYHAAPRNNPILSKQALVNSFRV